MNDSKRVYAMGAGIAAIILVIALALSVMSNQQTKTAAPAAAPRATTAPAAYRSAPKNSVSSQGVTRQNLIIPIGETKQRLTIVRKK